LRPPFTGASVRSFAGLLPLTAPFNLPAPGRCQPLYVVFDLAQTCVFVKQSPCSFHCNPFALGARSLSRWLGTPSSEVKELICRAPEPVFSQALWDIQSSSTF